MTVSLTFLKDAWDSYLQGNSLDPNSNSLWPMNVDPAILDPGVSGSGMNGNNATVPTSHSANLLTEQQQAAQNGFMGGGNVFMTGSPPPRGTMM